MKLTTERLKRLIREELNKINEIDRNSSEYKDLWQLINLTRNEVMKKLNSFSKHTKEIEPEKIQFYKEYLEALSRLNEDSVVSAILEGNPPYEGYHTDFYSMLSFGGTTASDFPEALEKMRKVAEKQRSGAAKVKHLTY